MCQCLRGTRQSEFSAFIVKKFDHSPTDRLNWSQTSPPRPSSPSKTRGSLTNCGSRSSSRPVTADVLKIISRSAFDLQTVFQTLIESAVRLWEADTGSITRQAGSTYLQVASYGYPAEFHEVHAKSSYRARAWNDYRARCRKRHSCSDRGHRSRSRVRLHSSGPARQAAYDQVAYDAGRPAAAGRNAHRRDRAQSQDSASRCRATMN